MNAVTRPEVPPFGSFKTDSDDPLRNAQDTRKELNKIGPTVQELEDIKLAAGQQKTLEHGLNGIPESVTFCPFGSPAPNVYLVSKNRKTITVANGGDPMIDPDVTVQVSILG